MKNKTNKNLLIISIIIFLLFCGLFFFVYREIANNIKLAQQAQVELQKEAIKREEIKDFNNSFKLIEQEKNLFETHFAQSSDIVPFLNTIEKMASSVGTDVAVSFIEVAKDNSGLVIEMKDTGTFDQVYKFLMLLENSPYELKFTSVQISNSVIEELGKNKKILKKKVWQAELKIKLISFI